MQRTSSQGKSRLSALQQDGYLAARHKQKDKYNDLAPWIRIVTAAIDDSETQGTKVLYLKQDTNTRPFVTTNPCDPLQHRAEQPATLWRPQHADGTNQLLLTTRYWMHRLPLKPDVQTAASALMALCTHSTTTADGLSCTAELLRRLKALQTAIHSSDPASNRPSSSKAPTGFSIALPLRRSSTSKSSKKTGDEAGLNSPPNSRPNSRQASPVKHRPTPPQSPRTVSFSTNNAVHRYSANTPPHTPHDTDPGSPRPIDEF